MNFFRIICNTCSKLAILRNPIDFPLKRAYYSN
nr:MAG TPA: hypothetical protein [Caudoviricetes sp.]